MLDTDLFGKKYIFPQHVYVSANISVHLNNLKDFPQFELFKDYGKAY